MTVVGFLATTFRALPNLLEQICMGFSWAVSFSCGGTGKAAEMTYNFMSPKYAERGPHLNDLPIIDCAFTQMTREWMNFQKGYCSEYELDFARCASRVGAVNAIRDCRKFMEDMQECAFHKKSLERYKIMQAERKKQGRPYLPTPPKDSVIAFYPQISS